MSIQEELFARHVRKSVLLDSNLLLVLLTGSSDPTLFARFKRVSGFTVDDYDLLIRFLGFFTTILTTPHVLTEVSNLANSLPEWCKIDWFRNFAVLIASEKRTPGLRECWLPARDLARTPEFAAFGMTDAALCQLSSEALVLTEDYRLSGMLRHKGKDVLNFAELRLLSQLFGLRIR